MPKTLLSVASVIDYDSIYTDRVGVKFNQPPTNFLAANKQSGHQQVRNAIKYHNCLFSYLRFNGYWNSYRALYELVGKNPCLTGSVSLKKIETLQPIRSSDSSPAPRSIIALK
jgi:hypothetical protein